MSCANKALTLTHKTGDTFHYVGGLKSNGLPMSLTGWQVAAFVRATDVAGEAVAGDPLSTPVVTVTNAALGAFTVRQDDTSAWTSDSRFVLEVVLTAPDATRTTLPEVVIQT